MISHGTQVVINYHTESALCVFGPDDAEAITGNSVYSASDLASDLKNCRASVFFCTGACYGGGLAREVRWNVRKAMAVSACGDNEIACTDLGASFVTGVISAFHKKESDRNHDGTIDLFEAYRTGFDIDRAYYQSRGYRPLFFVSRLDPLKTCFSSKDGWVVTSTKSDRKDRTVTSEQLSGKETRR